VHISMKAEENMHFLAFSFGFSAKNE